jgi:hypothetical protein
MAKKRNPSKKRDPLASAVIAELGGVAATARIFGVKSPSIMGWLEKGIPKARMMYLEVAYAKALRNARRIKSNGHIDELMTTDDTQQDGGGTSDRKLKEDRVAL